MIVFNPVTKGGDGGLDIEYAINPPITVVKIASSSKLGQVKKFYLDSPARLVIDVYGTQTSTASELIGRPELSQIRVGSHENKSRIVLEFPEEVAPKHRVQEEPDSIQILIAQNPDVNLENADLMKTETVQQAKQEKVAATTSSDETSTASSVPPAPVAPVAAVVNEPPVQMASTSASVPINTPTTQPTVTTGASMADDGTLYINARRRYQAGSVQFVLTTEKNVQLPPLPPKKQLFEPAGPDQIYEAKTSLVPREFVFKIKNARRGNDLQYMYSVESPSLTAVAVKEEGLARDQIPSLSFRFIIPYDVDSDPIITWQGTQLIFEFQPPVKEVEYGRKVRKTYTGQKISLDFQNADIHSLLRLISTVSGINIITSESVTGTLTMHLEDVPWDQALDVIVQAANLKSEQIGNVMWIITNEEYARQQKAIQDEKATRARAEEDRVAQAKAEMELERTRQMLLSLTTEVIPLSYISAEDLYQMILQGCEPIVKMSEKKEYEKIECLLTARGSVMVDKHNNALIVKDIIEAVDKVRELASKIDQPIPKILIEARIVEASTNLAREIGIRWGGTIRRPSVTIAGRAESSSSSTSDGTEDGGTGITDVLSALAPAVVNLPTVADPYGGLGVSIGRIFGQTLFQLDAQLTALEDAGKARIISAPKIMTMNNQEAIIKQGQEIPVTTRTEDGTFKTEYMDAALKLTVIPRKVPNADRVSLTLRLTEKQVLDREDILGNAYLAVKEATTMMLLEDGETMVLGGIAATNDSYSERRVPCLGTVPILGEAFKARNRSDEKNELLMFITANIIRGQNEKPPVRVGGKLN